VSPSRRYICLAVALFLLHAALTLFRYGQLPIAPILGDEVIINDPAVSLGLGQGYAATSFMDSSYGIDRLFAHFPPLYPLTESLAIRAFGVSVYSLRLTTTVMSIAEMAILLLLLFWLCRFNYLDFTTAGLVGAVYSTCTPLIVRERMARMESMIGVLVLLCVWAIFLAVAQTEEKRARPWLIAAGIFTGLSMAVHPEAVSAIVLLAPVMLFAVSGNVFAKFAGAALTGIVPVAIWIFTFGSRSAEALTQFRNILHHATPFEPGIGLWLLSLPHLESLSAANLALLILFVLLLLLSVLLAFFFRARKLSHSSIRYRLAVCFAVGSVLELGVMEWGLHIDCSRYQFLIGPLLIALAITAKGNEKLSRWQVWTGCLVVCIELAGVAGYLHARKDRIAEMNPDRFMPIVRSLGSEDQVVVTPGLWLDMRESGHPFVLLYPGFDGVDSWAKVTGNPLDRFDTVILESSDYTARMKETELEKYAASGRIKKSYVLGREVVNVYRRGFSDGEHLHGPQ
jgi:hypothetical protein